MIMTFLAQLCACACKELIGVDRAYDIIIGAKVKPFGNTAYTTFMSQKKDGELTCRFMGAKLGADQSSIFIA